MATAKKPRVSKDTILTLTPKEVTNLLAILNKAEELVNVSQPQAQSFLGGLIKKIKRASGGPVKKTT
jgi:hypothetical protein